MKRIFAVLLSALVLLSSGCSPVQPQQEQGMRYYYCVGADTHTGPAISYEVDQPEEFTTEALLRRLFAGPEQPELIKTFPAGTHLLGCSLENEILSVDLSEEFGGLSGIALRKAEYCIVLTLCQLEGVECITITVDGRSLPGRESGVLSADDIVLKGEIQDPINVSSQLYFPLADMTGLGLEYRVFEVADSSVLALANGVLDQLKSGPKEDEMTAFLYNSGKITAVSIQDGLCIVALDNASLSVICADQDTFPLYLYAIVDSLTEINGIDSVSFVIEEIAVPGFEDSYSAVYEF